jgi:hypothetical protein
MHEWEEHILRLNEIGEVVPLPRSGREPTMCSLLAIGGDCHTGRPGSEGA